MGTIRIGTYNVENLFDRFNDPYEKSDDPWAVFGTRPKGHTHLFQLGARVRNSKVDILALQEIENYGALKDFVQGHIGPGYKTRDGIVTLQSNDTRGIDLGLLSKLPIGRVISHRHLKSRINGRPVFSRDCLEIELLDSNGDLALTVYNCHLKSKFSKFEPGTREYINDQIKSANRRREQVERTIEIVQASKDIDNDLFVIVGDMNDTPSSVPLEPFLATGNPLMLTSALDQIAQTDLNSNSSSKRKRDTHKWTRKVDGRTVTTYSQIDYILCSQALWACYNGNVKVEQRGYTGGTDHYLAYAEFELPENAV